MSKKTVYRQCELQNNNPGYSMVEMAWIPSEFATVGRYLKVKDAQGLWVNGWRVTAVYDRMAVDEVQAARAEQKRFSWVLGG